MKADEAIAILKGEVVTMGELGRELMDEAREMGAKALERETGTRPRVFINFHDERLFYVCGRCGHELPTKGARDFCPRCGYAVDQRLRK